MRDQYLTTEDSVDAVRVARFERVKEKFYFRFIELTQKVLEFWGIFGEDKISQRQLER